MFIDLSRLKCIFFNNYFQLFIFLFRFFEFFVFSKSSSPDEVVSANLFFTRLQLYDVVLTGLTIQKGRKMASMAREYVYLKGRGNSTDSFLVQSDSYSFRNVELLF